MPTTVPVLIASSSARASSAASGSSGHDSMLRKVDTSGLASLSWY